ncbi:zinc finger protein 888-like [Haliotis cracherodii]|uniref:zinc finger protein 888-like n=1 Tax=Haliotis cracherodii TaxID=6455 RepID=UPI0039ED5A7A
MEESSEGSNQNGEELNSESIIPDTEESNNKSSSRAGISTHQCGICDASFPLLIQYLNHRIDHAGPQSGVSCELCGTAYSRQSTLREHYKKKHRLSFISKPSSPKSAGRQRSKLVEPDSPERQFSLNCGDSQPTSDDNSVTKTIHVVITRAGEDDEEKAGHEQEENDCSLDEKDIAESNHLDVSGRENVENDNLQNDIDNKVDEMQTDRDVDKMDVDEEKCEIEGNCSESNKDTDSTASPEKTWAGTRQSLQCFNDAEDFHFVLLKNMINGNSFKYSKDRFKCLHCEFQSYWRNSMCTHMKQMHRDMMSIHQNIQIKPLESQSDQGDQSIMKMSDYIANLKQKKTKSVECRIRSVEKQDLPGQYCCSKCGKEFNRLRYLRKHMLVHKSDKKYLCDECGKAFKTRSYLKTHYRTHKTRVYKCSQCNFSSSVNAVIHAHRQLHNDGSVICDVCGFAYADKSTLKKHKLVHDPDRPFPCTFPGCTWRFRTEVMCLAHYNAHTTEGKFRCSVCGYVFRHKHHLQRHQSKMHGITNTTNVTIVEEEKKEEKETTISDIPDTVNLIVNSDMSRDQLQSALQNGQLVIATDSEGNTINYEVADITMNVTYHTLLEEDSQLGDAQAILHVATIDSHDPS